MDPVTLAALVTAGAALLGSVVQAWKLWGPRRNGGQAVIRYLQAQLDECLKGREE